jgi:hypothetical protein
MQGQVPMDDATYLRDELLRLRALATRHGGQTLVYLLDMAVLEASFDLQLSHREQAVSHRSEAAVKH